MLALDSGASAPASTILRGHEVDVCSVCFICPLRHGRALLFSGDADGHIVAWDGAPFHSPLTRWRAHDGGVLAILSARADDEGGAQDGAPAGTASPAPGEHAVRCGQAELGSAPLRFFSQGRDGCIHEWEWRLRHGGAGPGTGAEAGDPLAILDECDASHTHESARGDGNPSARSMPVKLSTMRVGFGTFCRAHISALALPPTARGALLVAPAIDAAKLEVWSIGGRADGSVQSVALLSVPEAAARAASMALRRPADAGGDELDAPGSILRGMQWQTGMVTCTLLLRWRGPAADPAAARSPAIPANYGREPEAQDATPRARARAKGRLSAQLSAAHGQSAPESSAPPQPLSPPTTPISVLVAASFESGVIYILRGSQGGAETAPSEVLVALPVCRDPLLTFALRSDEAGGAAAGAGAFVSVFWLDIEAGGAAVTHRVALASPGAGVSLALGRHAGPGEECIAIGCWDSTVRIVVAPGRLGGDRAGDSAGGCGGRTAEAALVLRRGTAAIHSLALTEGALAAGDQRGRVGVYEVC